MDQAGDELDLGDYLDILRRRWAWVLLPLLALPMAAYFLTVNQPEVFDASARVLLGDSAAQDAVGGGQNDSFRYQTLGNEISLAVSDGARAEIADRLAITIDELPGYSVTTDSSADVLIFQASLGTPEGAATLANVAAETYVNLKQQQASDSITSAVSRLDATLLDLADAREEVRGPLVLLQDDLTRATEETRATAEALVEREASRISGRITLIDAQIEANTDSITQLKLSGELATGGTARIVSVANPPAASSNAPLSRSLVLSVVVAAILGAALALLRENLDNKVRSTEDFERLGLAPLGAIPKASKRKEARGDLSRVVQFEPDSPQAQAHQRAQAAVRFLAQQHNIASVLITSASQNEGKTTLASNLAVSMARSNTHTVLVDLDLRRPRVHKVYNLPQEPGITSVVVEGVDVVDSATLIDELDSHLAVVPAGKLPPHPASFISSVRFADTVKELSKLADFTVFDAPPVLPVADTLTLAQMVGGVILVAYANRTKRDDLEAAAESLSASGAHILGAVLLGAERSASGYEYYNSSDDLLRMDR